MCAFFVERFRFTMHFRQFCAKVGSLDTDEGQSENTFSPVILLITKTTKFHRSVYCRRVFVWARVNGSHCHEPFLSLFLEPPVRFRGNREEIFLSILQENWNWIRQEIKRSLEITHRIEQTIKDSQIIMLNDAS